jgi:hypothetical protein
MVEEDAFLENLVCTSAYDALRWAFAKCLQIPYRHLNRSSSFTQLGGNSLAAILLSNSLRQQGYSIPILDIIRRDTIEHLEEQLKNTSKANGAPKSNGSVEIESEAAPVTDMHKLMLTQSQRNPATNCQIARAKFVGPPESVPTPSELKEAWTTTLAAHSIFKTRYDLHTWTLHDLGHVNFDWEEISVETEDFDNALLSVEEQVWTSHQSLERLAASSLEVPYCHMTCVYDPSSKTIGFVWRVHHVLTDIFSGIILMHDLKRALAKDPVPVGPCLQDYAFFMQRYKDQHLGKATENWKRMMKPLREQSMFKFRAPQTSFQGNAWRGLPSATGETLESVEASVQRYNISSATLIFAAWALVLAKYTRSNLASFYLSRSGRMVPWPPAPSLVAAMHCRVPFNTCVPLEATVDEWLKEMHGTLHRVVELENLCQSLDTSICPEEYFKTGVQAFLYMPQMPDSWEVNDRLTGQASNVGMVWRVQPTIDGAVEAVLEIDQRMVDGEWAKEVGVVAVRMFEWLTNAPKDTKMQDLKLYD